MTTNIIYPEIDFPFQPYNSKVSANSHRVTKSVENVRRQIEELQGDRRFEKWFSIDDSESTFFRDDGINIKTLKNGFRVKLSVVD